MQIVMLDILCDGVPISDLGTTFSATFTLTGTALDVPVGQTPDSSWSIMNAYFNTDVGSLNATQLEQETWYGYFSNVNQSLASGGRILNSYLPDDYALQWMQRNDWIFRGVFESNPNLQNAIRVPAIRSELTLWGFPTLVSNNGALNNLWQSADPPIGETTNPLANAVNFLATQTGVQNSQPTGWGDNNGQGEHSDFVVSAYPIIWNWWSEFLAANSAMAVNDEK